MVADLGIREALSFALGGVIGGGIFAVPGVVVDVAGSSAWLAYLLADIANPLSGPSSPNHLDTFRLDALVFRCKNGSI